MVIPEDITRLDPRALTEHLLELASVAREAAARGDIERLGELRDALRRASDSATGACLSLLEVASGFIEALARSDLSPAELSVRAFSLAHPEDASELFDALFSTGRVNAARLAVCSPEVQRHLASLVDRGVLRRAHGGLVMQPRFFAMARELVEPAAFRMWRVVQHVREHAAYLPPNAAASLIEATVGVSRAQACIHLNRFPLRQELAQSRSTFKAPLWSRETPTKPSLEDQANASGPWSPLVASRNADTVAATNGTGPVPAAIPVPSYEMVN